jgi:hypothetical protein
MTVSFLEQATIRVGTGGKRIKWISILHHLVKVILTWELLLLKLKRIMA